MPNVRGIPHSKSDLKAVRIFRGLSIYKVRGSRYWYVRVWYSDAKKYRVKGTGETSRIEARAAAIDFARTILQAEQAVPVEFTFKQYAIKCLEKGSRLAAQGDRHIGTVKAIGWALQNNDWGLLRWFGRKDVRKIGTRDFNAYMEDLSQRRPELSTSSRNSIMSAFRNVMKAALEEGAIDAVPATPGTKQVDNPRPFFRFFPLVPEKDDALKRLLAEAKAMADEKVTIRGVPVTDELHDLIAFLVAARPHSGDQARKNGASGGSHHAGSRRNVSAGSPALSLGSRRGLRLPAAIPQPHHGRADHPARIQGVTGPHRPPTGRAYR